MLVGSVLGRGVVDVVEAVAGGDDDVDGDAAERGKGVDDGLGEGRLASPYN